MARFKQVPQAFLFNKLLTFFGNMVANYRDEVRDDDFLMLSATASTTTRRLNLLKRRIPKMKLSR